LRSDARALNRNGTLRTRIYETQALPTLPVLPARPRRGGEKTVYGLNEYASLGGSTWKWRPTRHRRQDRLAQRPRHQALQAQRRVWVRFYLAIDAAFAPDRTAAGPRQQDQAPRRRLRPEEGKNYTARPVIELDICMGTALRSIEVNLTDRSAFQYPLLIGSEALKRFDALVDPSLKYAAGKPACTTDAHTAE
jgi:hypothetical protein